MIRLFKLPPRRGDNLTESGQIGISALQIRKYLEITITDTGIGIPKDKLGTIFKVFEQVDSSSNKAYVGTGLGLSISKQLIE